MCTAGEQGIEDQYQRYIRGKFLFSEFYLLPVMYNMGLWVVVACMRVSRDTHLPDTLPPIHPSPLSAASHFVQPRQTLRICLGLHQLLPSPHHLCLPPTSPLPHQDHPNISPGCFLKLPWVTGPYAQIMLTGCGGAGQKERSESDSKKPNLHSFLTG